MEAHRLSCSRLRQHMLSHIPSYSGPAIRGLFFTSRLGMASRTSGVTRSTRRAQAVDHLPIRSDILVRLLSRRQPARGLQRHFDQRRDSDPERSVGPDIRLSDWELLRAEGVCRRRLTASLHPTPVAFRRLMAPPKRESAGEFAFSKSGDGPN